MDVSVIQVRLSLLFNTTTILLGMLTTQIQMLRELRITKALKKNVKCDINKLMPANLYLTKKKNLSAENRNSEWFLI